MKILPQHDIDKVITLIAQDRNYLRQFLLSADNPIFLSPLEKAGYFNPEYIFKNFEIGFCSVKYLNAVASALDKKREHINGKLFPLYSKHLLTLINSIIYYQLKNIPKEKKDSNTYVIVSFLAIITFLDKEYINKTTRDVFKILFDLYYDEDNVLYNISLALDNALKVKDIKTAQGIVFEYTKSVLLTRAEDLYNRNGYNSIGEVIKKDGKTDLIFTDVFLNKLLNLLERSGIRKKFVIKRDNFNIGITRSKGQCVDVKIESGEKNLIFQQKKVPFSKISSLQEDLTLKLMNLSLEKDVSEKISEAFYYAYFFNLSNKYRFLVLSSLFNKKEHSESEHDSVLRFISGQLLIKAQSMTKQDFKKKYLDKLKIMRQLVFPRIILYVYGKAFVKYRKEFFEYILKNKDRLFGDSYYEAELYCALEHNATIFTDDEKNKINNLIKNGPYPNDTDREKYKRYFEKRWYSALKNLPEFDRLYQGYNDLGEEHLNFKNNNFRAVEYKSPKTAEETYLMFKETPQDIESFSANLLTQSQNTSRTDIFNGKPCPEGLAANFRSVARENPLLIIKNLNHINNLHVGYIKAVVEGLSEEANNISQDAFYEILTFIDAYIRRDNFFKDKSFSGEYLASIDFLFYLGMLFSKLKNISKLPNDSIKKLIKNILLFLYENRKKFMHGFKAGKNDDILTIAINTPTGKILESSISMAWFFSEIEGTDITWPPQTVYMDSDIQKILDDAVKNKEPEIFIALGYQLNALRWLNWQWTQKTIESLIPNTEEWFYYFHTLIKTQGSLFWFYDYLKYDMLCDLPNYSKRDDNFKKRFADLISVFYLNDKENFKDGYILNQVLSNQYFELLQNMARYMGWLSRYRINSDKDMEKEKIPEEKKILYNDRIISFWEECYENLSLKKKLDKTEKELALELLDLTPSFKYLTLRYKSMIDFSLGFSDNFNHDFEELIKTLIKISNNDKKSLGDTSKMIGEIFETCVQKHGNGMYLANFDLKFILNYLIDNGQVDILKKIMADFNKHGVPHRVAEIAKSLETI